MTSKILTSQAKGKFNIIENLLLAFLQKKDKKIDTSFISAHQSHDEYHVHAETTWSTNGSTVQLSLKPQNETKKCVIY